MGGWERGARGGEGCPEAEHCFRRRGLWLIVCLLAVLAAATSAQTPPPTGFVEILAEVGLEPTDLAAVAAPEWLGHPPAASIPYLLPHVEPARRDPRYLVALGGNVLHAARHHRGDPQTLATLFTVLILQPRLPGFRGLILPVPELPATPGALTAVLAMLGSAADPLAAVDYRQPLAGPPWPAPGAAELDLPPALRLPVARLLGALVEAGRAVERSWRRVPAATLARAVATREVPRLLAGGTVGWPALDDAARDGDDVERARAALRLLAGLERAAAELAAVAAGLEGFDRWAASTPWGRVIVAGRGAHRHACDGDCLLIVDLGGDDEYAGDAAAAVAPRRPVAAVLDLAGDDRYRTAGAGQGAGLGGVAMLVDFAGDDLYEAGDGAQGYGLLGYGLLWDAAGRDRFVAAGGGQGAAVFGGGLLVSGSGDDGGDGDDYRLLGEGQGFGGPGACGALVDLGGNDSYFAEPDPERAAGRADYHSGGRVAASNAQGAGVGRRGDQSDGRVWAGGVGLLVDLGGDDRYTAGNFAQGMGYWYGTGMLLDAAGDDVYGSVYFSQASAAHFSLALLWDGAGNDRHLLAQEAAASLGYGWDFATSVLIEGGGDDLYQAASTALGTAELSSVALFLELGGGDVYRLPAGARALGAVGKNAHPWRRGGPLRAAALASQVGLFVDLGGVDDYPHRVACGRTPGNGRRWTCDQGDPGSGAPHLGAGIDLEQPVPPEVIEWLGIPARTPP